MYIKIIYEGDGEFKVFMEDGTIKNAGSNLCGMIRYTYFDETDDYPPIGWEVTREKLMEDYQPKVLKDVMDGKIKEL